jgi:hypothetical protein
LRPHFIAMVGAYSVEASNITGPAACSVSQATVPIA